MVRSTLLGLLAFTVMIGLSAQETAKKRAVPGKEAQTKALELVLDIFKDDIQGAKDHESKSKLASYLIQQGRESKDEPANRYVLFIEATAMASGAGDAPLALTAIDELAKDFEVDAWKLKAVSLAVAVEQSPSKETSKSQFDLLLPMIAETVEADNYDIALALCKVADSAARKSKSLALVATAQKRQEEVEAVQKGFARLQNFVDRLKENPKDGEANLELGKYYALLKNRWERALPLLAMGSDPALAKLARTDLGKPEEAPAQLALADGWWDSAAAAADPARLSLQRRATHWYEQALGGLSGLSRTKALKRIDVVAAKGSGVGPDVPAGPVGELKKFEGHSDEVKSVALSADGRYAASGGIDQTLRIWDLTTGKEDKALRGHSKQIWSVVFHPNNRQVFSASWDATARLWDIRTGNEVKRFSHRLDLNGLALSRDAGLLLTASDDHSVYQWSVSSGEELRRVPGHTGFVYSVDFAPDGRSYASGSVDRTVRVVDLNTGQLTRSFENGHTSAVTNVAISPDGRHVFASGGNVIQWDIATGNALRRFEGHTGAVMGMALSPDGRRLLTGGDDKTIRLWDTASGKEMAKLTGHTDSVICVAFSSDGRRAVSGSLDRTVRLWGLPAR